MNGCNPRILSFPGKTVTRLRAVAELMQHSGVLVKIVLCSLGLLFAAASSGWALSYDSSEGGAVRALKIQFLLYAHRNEGRAPSSWADIQTMYKSPIEEVYGPSGLTKRYAFLSERVSLLPPYEGDLLFVTRRPFRDTTIRTYFWGHSTGLREPGRHIIYRASTGSFRHAYVDELYIQRTFRGFESLLPTPDSEPMRPHEVKDSRPSVLQWTVGTIAAAFLIRFFSRYLPKPLPKN